MDRNIRQSIKTFVRHAFAAGICVIVVISGRVASAETDAVDIPVDLANKLRPPITKDGALDTPFFDAKKAEITLKSLKGEGIVMNIWATWCAPCVREMPALDNLAKKLEGTGVRILAVSEDRKALNKVPPFFAANNIKNLALYYDERAELSRKLGVSGLPTTVLIHADGTVAGRVLGVLEWDSPEVVQYLVQTLRPKTP